MSSLKSRRAALAGAVDPVAFSDNPLAFYKSPSGLLIPRRAIMAAPAIMVARGANAQIPFPIFPGAAGTPGPRDITTGWLGWWGLRAFSLAVAATGTQKCVNVRRASDNTTLDILILTTGFIDVGTLATFIASTTGFVTKIYDQSGGGLDASNATAGQQPQILLTGGPGTGNPSIKFVGSSSQRLSTTGSIVPSTTTGSYSFVSERVGAGGGVDPVLFSSAAGHCGHGFSANQVYNYSGAVLEITAPDGAWHAVNCTQASPSTNSTNNVDGVTVTGDNGGGTTVGGQITIGANAGASQFLTGNFVEGGINNQTFSAGQVSAINSNQHSAWGF
jgi:hypothetical protein